MPTLVASETPAAATGSGSSSWAGPVRWVAAGLVAGQVLLRGRLVSRRDHYGDDFRLLHLADTSDVWSAAYLFHDFDGHFMPGGLLLVGVVERVAPLEWPAAATTVVAMQLLASLAFLRLLRVLLGDRPLLLVPLVFGLFTPLTLGSLTWWAASVNSLPLQIGLALFLAEAALLVRTGARRHALVGTAVYALTLLFYLKAVLVPWVGVGVAALVLAAAGVRWPLVAALRRGFLLWLGSLVVTGAWAVAYVRTRTGPTVTAQSADPVLDTVRGGFRVLASSVTGGPAGWGTFPPGAPFASLREGLVTAGGLALLAACLGTCLRRRGAVLGWLLVLGTATSGLVMAGVGRSAPGLNEFVPLAARYFAIEAVVLPAVGGLLATLPLRRWWTAAPGRPLPRPVRRVAAAVTAGATLLWLGAAVSSTLEHGRAWEDDRTGAWLAAVRSSLAAAGPAPLLEQRVPADALWAELDRENLVSEVLSPLEDRPPFADWTTELRALDDAGVLRPAEVVPAVAVAAGPVPVCGWSVTAGAPAAVALTGPLPAAEWTTVRLSYVADRAGAVTVAPTIGEPVRAPVQEGVHTLYLRLTGGGADLRVTVETPGMRLCLGEGVAGDVVLR